MKTTTSTQDAKYGADQPHDPQIHPNTVYSSQQVAQLLGVTPRTLLKWRKQRWISYRKIGGVIIFMGSDLLEALENCKFAKRQV